MAVVSILQCARRLVHCPPETVTSQCKKAFPELAFHLLPVNRGKALKGTGWPASSRRRASAEAAGLKEAMNTNKEETG
jgi:hypothetical protein